MNTEYVFDDRLAGSFERPKPANWLVSFALYVAVAIVVFLVQGPQPLFGPDHVSYMSLCDSIRAARPDGDYWREFSSVRIQGVLLAYLHGLTQDNVLSLKLLLVLMTVPYLVTLEALLSCFTSSRRNAVLFTIVGGFAVSFGVASWGITDSTAMLNRTLVMPAIFLIVRHHIIHFTSPWRFASYVFLVLVALLHLSAFHVLGVLLALDIGDLLWRRRPFSVSMTCAMIGALAGAAAVQFALEKLNLSAKLTMFLVATILPGLLASNAVPESSTAIRFDNSIDGPRSHAGDAVARAPVAEAIRKPEQEQNSGLSPAWRAELALRPWRNMPLPLANLANIFSSYGIVLPLALAGVRVRWRVGPDALDRYMVALFLAIPLVAFGPQTLLWALRGRTWVPPINLEEIRVISMVMIPSLYFALRLFESIRPGRYRSFARTAMLIAFVALPLAMKSLPAAARHMLLDVAERVGAVDARNPSAVQNARYALGIAYDQPYFFSTIGARRWLEDHPDSYHRLLTDRDEFMLLNRSVVGPRQVAVAPTDSLDADSAATFSRAFFETRAALEHRDLDALLRIARRIGADMVVIPWSVPDAVYRDSHFSLVPVKSDTAKSGRDEGGQ